MSDGDVNKQIPEITTQNLERFLENQSQIIQNNAKVLLLKEQELKERTEQIKLNQEVALKSIEAKRHSIDNNTQIELKKQKYKVLIITLSIISVLTVCLLTICLGKDELTKDIFKYIGGAVLGFVAGRGSIRKSDDK